MTRKKRQALSLVIIMLLVLSAIATSNRRVFAKQDEEAVRNANVKGEVNAVQLGHEFVADHTSAIERYDKKVFLIKGKVSSVEVRSKRWGRNDSGPSCLGDEPSRIQHVTLSSGEQALEATFGVTTSESHAVPEIGRIIEVKCRVLASTEFLSLEDCVYPNS